jgi:type I restriction enzyme S subunit
MSEVLSETKVEILNSREVEIPVEWEIEKIGDIAEKTKGTKPNKLYEEPGSDRLPYLTISASRDEISQWAQADDGKRVSENQILIVWDGASSGTVFKSTEGIIGSTLASLSFDGKGFDNEFAYYFLTYSEDRISSLAEGTGIPHVPRDFTDIFQILKPPLSEQRRIAEILSTVDKQIQQTDEIIENTNELKQGLMQDLFTNGLNDEKQTEVRLGAKVRKVPQHWKVVRLDEISEIKRGASPRPIGDDKYFGGDVGWIRISDITQTNSKYVTEPSDYLSELGVSESVLIEPKTLVLSISATIGKPAILRTKGCIHDGIVALRNLGENVDIEYVYYALQDLQPRIQAQNQRAAGHQTNVNSKVVRQSEIPLPPLSEQRKIADILGTVDGKLEDEKDQLNALKDLKRALMQDLLTGEVRTPKDILD